MRVSTVLAWLFLTAAVTPAFSQSCVFDISPTSANFSASGGNDIIYITLVSGAPNCQRTATSNSNWISISFGTPGTGNGTVGFTVSANQFTVERAGTITVAGKVFTVTQAAGTCNFSLSPSSASVPAAGTSASFNLTVASNGCEWSAASSAEWLTVTSAPSGSGATTVRYVVGPNTGTSSRTGTISVAGLTFTVTQAGMCAFTLNPTSATVANTGATGSITVTASASSCAWTATSTAAWVTLTGSVAGTGNGTVTFAVAANTTLQDRSASINIGNTGFAVFQPGSTCTFSLSALSRSFPAEGGSGSFYVTSTCPWTAYTDAQWVTITSQPNTTGSGTVSFVVTGNTDSNPRTAYINVGNRSYSVIQAGVACSVTLTGTGVNISADGGPGSIRVLAGGGCSWVASTTATWVTLTRGSGSGEDDVVFTVAPNTTPQQRSAIVTIANQRFTIVQDGANCTFQISPAQAAYPAAGGTGTLTIGTVCSWAASTSVNWIALTSATGGTGAGTVTFTVASNTSTDARSGVIRISGQSITISQSGKDCTVSVAPESVVLPGRGGTATITVTGSKGCRWQPDRDAGWIAIPSWSAVDGSGGVTIGAEANPNAAARFGSVSLGGKAIAVTQRGLEVLPARGGVLSAASFAAGPVAPGEIVTIFGSGMGPAELVKLRLTADGTRIESKLAETQVLFDGIPAPLIYVSDKQLSAVVPYGAGTGGRPAAELYVVNQGVYSEPLQVQLAASNPAIFTVDATGRGQGAVLNQDNSVNSATNPAARNSVVQIFATGEGQTDPEGEDGKIAAGSPLPRPRLAVSVSIGGQNATVTYAGAAPGAMAGLFQVNARIPQNVAPGGSVPVIVRVGQASSPAGVTIAVR